MSDPTADPVTGASAEGVPAPVPVVAPEAATPAAPEAAPARVLAPVPPGSEAYETLIIVFARFEGEALQGLITDLKAIFSSGGAAVEAADVIGRRPLAYKIQKQGDGIYVNFVYTAPPASIRGIERDLGHHEQVMRYLTTRAVRV